MLRQLLTVLALVTGLAALGVPVQAARPGAPVEAIDEGQRGTACATAPVVLQLDNRSRRGRDARDRPCPPSARTVVVPTVQLHADRARE